MADECTDVTTIEELPIFCHSVEDGQPVEDILETVPLKATDTKTIYNALIKFMKDKNIQISKLVGMGFDGAANFSGEHNGVQSLLKKNSPHAVFCTLPLPLASTCLCSSIQCHQWDKTCIRHTQHPLEIFPLLSQVS